MKIEEVRAEFRKAYDRGAFDGASTSSDYHNQPADGPPQMNRAERRKARHHMRRKYGVK